MGYRSQNNLDAAERARWRKLPWRERFSWQVIAALLIIVAAFAVGWLLRVKFGQVG